MPYHAAAVRAVVGRAGSEADGQVDAGRLVQTRGRAAPARSVVLLPVVADPRLGLDVAELARVGERGVEGVLLAGGLVVGQQVAAVGGGKGQVVEGGRVVSGADPAGAVVVGEGVVDRHAAEALVEVEGGVGEADDLAAGRIGDARIGDDGGAGEVDLLDAVGRHAALAEPEFAIAVVCQGEVELADVGVGERVVGVARRGVEDVRVRRRVGVVADLVGVLERPGAEGLFVLQADAGVGVVVVDQSVALGVDAVVVVEHALVDLAVEGQRRLVREGMLDRRQAPLRRGGGGERQCRASQKRCRGALVFPVHGHARSPRPRVRADVRP